MKKLLMSAPWGLDFGLLVFRLSVTIPMFLTHGWSKLIHFSEKSDKFADPFHVTPAVSLGMVIFAEFVCSILITLGLFTRLATIPLIICFATIFFNIHGGKPFGDREDVFIYMMCFVTLFFTGPGKYSLDRKALKR